MQVKISDVVHRRKSTKVSSCTNPSVRPTGLLEFDDGASLSVRTVVGITGLTVSAFGLIAGLMAFVAAVLR